MSWQTSLLSIVVELHRRGSSTDGPNPSSFEDRTKNIGIISILVPDAPPLLAVVVMAIRKIKHYNCCSRCPQPASCCCCCRPPCRWPGWSPPPPLTSVVKRTSAAATDLTSKMKLLARSQQKSLSYYTWNHIITIIFGLVNLR